VERSFGTVADVASLFRRDRGVHGVADKGVWYASRRALFFLFFLAVQYN
jgi:hypothetical protein